MRPLRGALVGHGFIGERGHMPAYASAAREGIPIEIVAVADIRRPCLQRALATSPSLHVYDDYRDLLLRETSLDFVDIATPPYLHAAIAHAAFDRGLHVLCEKPIATSADDASSMLAHAARAKRVFFPSHNYKHAPVIQTVRSILDDDLIGDPHLVTLQTFRTTHARGVDDFLPDWRRVKRYAGGGIATDHGAHTFYLAFDWLGSYPTSITAKMSMLDDSDTEDNLSCSMTFPTGLASAHLSWTAGDRKILYTIHGAHGAVRVEDDDIEVAVMQKKKSGMVSWDRSHTSAPSDWMDASHVGWFTSLFRDFVRAIGAGDYVGREARDAEKCVELIETAYASAQDGSREHSLGVSPRAVTRQYGAAASAH